ncbi:16S rRNA (guanine(527)-N(7))-methyltransferase RsmG [Caproicibacterium lactatifermentans]|uniref:Ribosomal RNA small subunit methyltransferase G n=2 Tax=Oscillospiraceae TaxID=216572 RepID=A0A859DT05_9FIRM|nr:16S rRNA (guanine(527)-N(7))-methyltransferase RsmG [Caproicibacterium lactatifermentans]QKO31186.1 16S rRNA (guanine(527)-N(7))-methyltransferase RsmG [Caproicibacterium lactatifermentans]
MLNDGAAACGISLSAEQCRQFQQYMEQLLEWNTKINLTAITEPEAFVQKHFLDSLYPLQWISLSGQRCIDVGTGAGFPGIPLKLAVPDMRLTLLDGLQKRLCVLEDISRNIKVDFNSLHARAEEAGKNVDQREQYNFAFARAVAPLPVLCEYCLPLVKVGGSFCAWKGPAAQEELADAQNALQVLGGKLERAEQYTLPDGSERTFLQIRHEKHCPASYPRTTKKMKKNPL